MPPKKGSAESKKDKPAAQPTKGEAEVNTRPVAAAEDDTSKSKKRKTPSASDEPQKSARRSGRSAAKSQPSREQLLSFMLSKDAEELCRPEDESEDIKTRGGGIKTYSSSVMSPFEELLCAVILSRPISHRLGLRSIRTILNDPYNFSTPKAIQAAGQEKCHQALWDARTQHKAKTAEQIGSIADVVLGKFTAKDDTDGTQMRKLLDDCDGDVEKALDTLKDSIKGLGATGLNIFLRRVQWLWEKGFPYVDDRTSLSLRKLGLPEEAEDLRKVVEQHWGKLQKKGLAGEGDAQKRRRAFVVILERAVGADLEGKVDELAAAAAAA